MLRIGPFVVPIVLVLIVAGHSVADEGAKYRTGAPDPRIASVPESIRQTIFTRPGEAIEPLVRHLVGNVDDEFLKVKILHDWIADNIEYDVANYLSGGRPESSWQETLLRRRAFCQGYAELFQEMCRLAAVPCEVVPGYGRGFGFQVGQAEDPAKGGHAWNAVNIRGRWRLIDVTWDAGHVNGRAYQKQYGTPYLFAEPGHFLHTHFPTDPRWQLVERPLSAAEFAGLPLLKGRLFEKGLRLATPIQRMHAVGESVQISLEGPDDTLVTAEVVDAANGGTKLPGRTQIRRWKGETNILASFPAAGTWGIKLFTRSKNEQGSYWEAAVLEFRGTAGTPWTFAETFSTVAGIESFLEAPLFVPLPAGQRAEFKIRVRGAEKVQLRIGDDQWIPMRQAADGFYAVGAVVPAGSSVKIVANPSSGGNTYWTLADFSK